MHDEDNTKFTINIFVLTVESPNILQFKFRSLTQRGAKQ
jgi:hypothetical protein